MAQSYAKYFTRFKFMAIFTVTTTDFISAWDILEI